MTRDRADKRQSPGLRLALGGARRTTVGFVMDYDFISRGLQPITVRNVESHAGKASLSRVYSAPLFH